MTQSHIGNSKTMDLLKPDILLPIFPQHAAKIYSGKKKYEFRKAIPKKNFNRVFLYETGIQLVTGFITIKSILFNNPALLWSITCYHAGISKSVFDQYFKDKEIAYALEIASCHQLVPFGLKSLGINHPPQSFCYINGEGVLND